MRTSSKTRYAMLDRNHGNLPHSKKEKTKLGSASCPNEMESLSIAHLLLIYHKPALQGENCSGSDLKINASGKIDAGILRKLQPAGAVDGHVHRLDL